MVNNPRKWKLKKEYDMIGKSQQDRVLAALLEGDELTAPQIRSRFGAQNPHEVIRQIRLTGYPVYLNESKNSKGTVRRKYRIGAASKRLVAAGYRALAAGV
jgi:hypothetical protein